MLLSYRKGNKINTIDFVRISDRMGHVDVNNWTGRADAAQRFKKPFTGLLALPPGTVRSRQLREGFFVMAVGDNQFTGKTVWGRFWEKVNKNGPLADHMDTQCWLWEANIASNGYGRFWYGGRQRQAHRVAWTLFISEIPNGLLVLHHCDNKRCIRPNHLYLGTQDRNMKDASRRGLMNGNGMDSRPDMQGENHFFAKLTADDIRDIRGRYAAGGVRYKDIAQDYGVSKSTVGQIVRRERWAHID